MSHESEPTEKVAILLFNLVEPLDFAGPFEVFISASNRGRDFDVFTVAEDDRPVLTVGSLTVNPTYTFASCPQPDILLIPGGWGVRQEMYRDKVTTWIREMSEKAEIVLSVCTGALILAKAGLLDGLNVTTNRSAIKELEEIVSNTTHVFPEARYTDNGKIVLSAGVSAGMDASLYVVSRLLGEERAHLAANIMEYDWRR